MASHRSSPPENRPEEKESLFAMIADNSSEDERREIHLHRRRRAARANARAMEQGVIKSPNGKGRHRRMTRPIFKEPGSKMGTLEEGNEMKDPQPPKRVPIVQDIRGECQKMMVKQGDFGTIEPRNTTNERLRTIVSRGAAEDPSGKQGVFNTSKYLNRRGETVGQDEIRYDKETRRSSQGSLDTPVELQRTASDLSYIRHEVTKMMNYIVPKRSQSRLPPNGDGWASKKNSRKLAENEESRDERIDGRSQLSEF
jgi:hypothetical protein